MYTYVYPSVLTAQLACGSVACFKLQAAGAVSQHAIINPPSLAEWSASLAQLHTLHPMVHGDFMPF